MNICEVCKQKTDFLMLCDYVVNLFITSAKFKMYEKTCDKRLCEKCAVEIWKNCHLCPEHSMEVFKKIKNQKK